MKTDKLKIHMLSSTIFTIRIRKKIQRHFYKAATQHIAFFGLNTYRAKEIKIKCFNSTNVRLNDNQT